MFNIVVRVKALLKRFFEGFQQISSVEDQRSESIVATTIFSARSLQFFSYINVITDYYFENSIFRSSSGYFYTSREFLDSNHNISNSIEAYIM